MRAVVIRRLDFIGFLLLTVLAAALIGGGVVLVDTGIVKEWQLVAILSFGGVLVAAAHPRAPSTTPHNTMVHGTARPAAEPEAHAAARGNVKSSPMHDATFPN